MNDELKVFGINMLGTVAWLDEVVMLSHLSETAVADHNQFVTRKRKILNTVSLRTCLLILCDCV